MPDWMCLTSECRLVASLAQRSNWANLWLAFQIGEPKTDFHLLQRPMIKSTKWKKAIKLNQVNQWGNPCSPTFHPISIISLMARFWLQVTLLNCFMMDSLLARTSQRLAAALSTLIPWWTWGSVCGGCQWRWPTWWTSRRGAGPAWRGAARCMLSWCPIIIKIIEQVTNAGVTLPSAFTRERNNIKRKGIFRPRSMVIDDDIPMSSASPQGYFMQQHTDAKTFMEEHFMVSQAVGKGFYSFLLLILARWRLPPFHPATRLQGKTTYGTATGGCSKSMGDSILTFSLTPSPFLNRERCWKRRWRGSRVHTGSWSRRVRYRENISINN